MTSKSRAHLIVIICILTSLVTMGASLRNPIIPLYARNLGASIAETGLVVSIFSLVSSLMSMPMGLLSDRFGRKRLIILGIILQAFASILLAVSNKLYLVVLAHIIAGMGLASYMPALFAFVRDVSQIGYIGKAYGVFSSAHNLAFASGPALGGILAALLGFRGAFLWSSAIILIGALGAMAMPRGSRDHFSQPKSSLKQSFSRLGHNVTVVACLISLFCINFLHGMLAAFFPLLASDIGFDLPLIGVLMGTMTFGGAIVRLPAGALYDRVRKRKTLLMMTSLVVGAFATMFTTFFINPIITASLLMVFGLAWGFNATSGDALTAEAINPEDRGLAMGIVETFFTGGMAAGSMLMGPLIAIKGFQTSFLIASTVGYAGAFLLYLLGRKASYK
ncbi:MAG: MFS transporter [Candidatus Bathyarchaeia archaeon]